MADFSLFAELRASISEFSAKMAEARSELSKTEAHGSAVGSKMSAVGKDLLLGVGGAAVAVGGFALKMADDFETSHARLAAAVTASGTSMDKWNFAISAVQKELEGLGFTHAQFQDALSHSVVSTQDVARSLNTMHLAADLARLKNIDLTSATDALDKALIGNLRPLKQLGIDLPVTATNALKLQQAQDAVGKATETATAFLAKHPDAVNAASKAHAGYEAQLAKVHAATKKLSDEQNASGQILDALTQRLDGQAQAAAETFGGRIGVLKTKVEDWAAALGMRLIPIIEQTIDVVGRIVGWLERHRDVAMALGVAVGTVLVAAMASYAESAAAAAAATVAALAPFIAVVAAVDAVAAGVIYAYTHWKFFRDVVQAVADFVTGTLWPALKQIADFLAGVFKAAVQTAIDIFTTLSSTAQTVWQAVSTAVSTAWGVLKPIFDLILNVALIPIRIEMKLLSDLWDAVWPAISSAVSTAWGIAKPVFGFFVDLGLKVIGTAVGDLQTAFSTGWDLITKAVQVAWAVLQPIFGFIKRAIDDIAGPLTDVIGGISSFASNPTAALSHAPVIGSLFRAAGGPVSAGQPYVVGERGPELFMPGSSGSIVPNRAMGGGGGVVINVSAGTIVGSGGMQELAETIRRELIRIGVRNGGTAASSGILGGLA